MPKKIINPTQVAERRVQKLKNKSLITTDSSSYKPKKQAHTSFLNHKGGFHNNTNYPRYGNWILKIGEDSIYPRRDIYNAVQETISHWVTVTEYLDLNIPSDRKTLRDRLNQILLNCLNNGFASGDDWVIKFGEDE